MGSILSTQTEKSESPWLRRFFIGVLCLALIGSLITGAVLYLKNEKAESALESFQQALDEGSYETAVTLYRQVREKALSVHSVSAHAAQYQTVLTDMDQMIKEKLDGIEKRLTEGNPLSDQDVALVSGLAELSAAPMIACLRALAHDYLFSEVDLAVVSRAFSSLSELDNISQGVAGISEEFDQMATIRLDAAKANENLEKEHYWAAWAGYQALLETEGLGPFTKEQIRLQMEQCKEIMYQPLLDEAEKYIKGGRYLSAKESLTALLAVFPEKAAIEEALQSIKPYLPEQLVLYEGAIEFITVKPLINNTALAFDGDAYAAAADDSMLTVSEFCTMLDALYENQYILIDGDALYDESRIRKPLWLPPGKKPLVLVLEGLNYYVTRRETGNAWNLVLDEKGEVAAEVLDASGEKIVDRNGEAIGLLDQFVTKHPDFSLDGAKGTISLTGYECIFGYVTNRDQLEDRNQALESHGMAKLSPSDAELAENKKAVKEIILRLTETGWKFASSTYGFINARDQDLKNIQADTEKWLDQVGRLTGPVTMLHYPNGAYINGSDERADYLKDKGFILFGGIGASAYLYEGDRYFYVDKVPINGYTLRNSRQFGLERFFDANQIYDRSSRGH